MKAKTAGGRRAAAVLLALVIAGCGGGAGQGESRPGDGPPNSDTSPLLERDEVASIMEHAARAVDPTTSVNMTDRRGVILGVAANFDLPAGTTCTEPFPAPAPTATPPISPCSRAHRRVLQRRSDAAHLALGPLHQRRALPAGDSKPGAAALFGIENTNRGCSFDAALDDGCSTPARSCRARAASRRRSPI
jgi:hypothetical protein